MFRSLAAWLRPCVHYYRQVSVMYDDPDRPRRTTLVNQCELCGEVQRIVVAAEGPCGGHDHKWTTINKARLYSSADAVRPIGEVYTQKCDRCGDLRRVDLKGNESSPVAREE